MATDQGSDNFTVELGNADTKDSAQNKEGTVDKDEADFR
jgi:hypothetical protein